jgi:hypothetical protein
MAQANGLGFGGNSVVFGPDSGLSAVDYNGDCYTTQTDVALQYLVAVGWTLQVGDLDGDGIESVSDSLRSIEKFIRASFADVNGDGVVDINDALSVAIAAGQATGSELFADVTLDGQVDTSDIVAVSGKIGQPSQITDVEFSNAAWLVYHSASMLLADGIDSVAAIESYEHCVGGDRDYNVHDLQISRDWGDNDHDVEVSETWPNNHEYQISISWSEYGHPGSSHDLQLSEDFPYSSHDVQLSQDENWPANHDPCISDSWSGSGRNYCNVTHSYDVSESRPENHETRLSRMWSGAPNHLYEYSTTWDNTDHSTLDSRTWPANHLYEVSRRGYIITGHDESISGQRIGHDVERSRQWPSNHTMNVSDGWINSHSTTWSVGWPSNHQAFVSSDWQNPVYPGAWPPNHMLQESGGTPPGPGSWEQWFPNGHYIMESLNELWDIPGDIWDLVT